MSKQIRFNLIDTSESSIQAVNSELTQSGVSAQVVSNESNQAWLDNINNSRKSSEEEMTMVELKDSFSVHTEIGFFEGSVSTDLMPSSEAKALLDWIAKNHEKICDVTGIGYLVEHYEGREDYSTLLQLETPPKLPEMLPEEEQFHPKSAGVAEFKSLYGPQGSTIFIAYGNVENCQYLRERIYMDDSLNSIVKDSAGRATILVPLMPPGLTSSQASNFIGRVYNESLDLGLHESVWAFTIKAYRSALSSFDVGPGGLEFDDLDEVLDCLRHVAKSNLAGRHYPVSQVGTVALANYGEKDRELVLKLKEYLIKNSTETGEVEMMRLCDQIMANGE